MSAASRLLILPRTSPITKKAFKIRSSHKNAKKNGIGGEGSRASASASAPDIPNVPGDFARDGESRNSNEPGSPAAHSCEGSSSDVPMSTSTSSSYRSMNSMRSTDSKTKYARPYAVAHSQNMY